MVSLRDTCWVAVALVAGFGSALPASAADYAPLDCTKANSQAQRAICSSYQLGQLEARMATLFELTTSLVAMGQRGAIQEDQRSFLKERDACQSNIGCIRDLYGTRIKQLEAIMSGIREHGPF